MSSSSSSRREEWRRRVERYVWDGTPIGAPLPPEVEIPDARWLQALAIAAFERTADATDRPGPNQTIAVLEQHGEHWQAAMASRIEHHLEDVDHRLREWCWQEGAESWDVEDLLPPPSS